MTDVPVLMHVPHEPPGLIDEVLLEAGLHPRLVPLYERVPERLDLAHAAALVVMGGPMNVDEVEKHPFLGPEITWIREAIDRRLPVLGMCLGSQLIAKALRATVYPNAVKEIGWYPIELTDAASDDPLFTKLSPRPMVFQWHGDTFELPAGATLLARGEQCAHQAFRYGENVYAFQFHLEVTEDIIESWLDEPGNRAELAELDYIDPAEITRRTPDELPAMLAHGRRVFEQFAELCLR